MKRLVRFSLFFLPILAFGQQIPLDTWRSHYSHSSVRILEKANNTLFCASQNGIFTVDLSSRDTRKLGKENGLGGVAPSAIHFSESQQVVIIGYPDGTIDIIDKEGTITTIITLRDSPIVANKAILDIVSNGSDAYLATGFGVVRLKISTYTVIENYRNIGSGGVQLSIREMVIKGDSLFVLSSSGIQSGSLNDNLLDFNDWTFYRETNSGNFNQLVLAGNKLYTLLENTQLWAFNGENWQDQGILFSEPIVRLHANPDLLALSSTGIYSAFPTPMLIKSDPLLVNGSDLISNGNGYMIADLTNGLLAFDGITTQIASKGPLSDYPTKVKSIEGKTFALFGPSAEEYNGVVDLKGYSVFEEGVWMQKSISGFYNISDVAKIGSDYFFSSMGFGIYDLQNGTRLSESNSSLKAGNQFSGVQIAAIESYENTLLAGAYNSPDALYQISLDRTIKSYSPIQTGFSRPLSFNISQEGLIWAIRGSQDGAGIGIYDPVLDQKRSLRVADGLPNNTVTGLSINTEDEVWIGTASGIGTFSYSSFPFNSFGVTIPIFDNRYLFEGEVINDVLTDGGDRVWVATNTGVWVLSRDLTKVVHRFTSFNSPLPSDQIRGFAYDGNSGEVFISTDKGMVSYRSSSSTADVVQASSILIFPNPVRLGFDGTIGITGLVRNASVKITDVMGRLVADLNADGGTASWDLRTFNGAQAGQGIYLIFSSSVDGIETMVGKIAILK